MVNETVFENKWILRAALLVLLVGPFALESSAASKKATGAAGVPDGIETQARGFINRGQWAPAVKRLEELTSNNDIADRDDAWLAFAYLYQGKHQELKALGEKVAKMPENKSDPAAAKIVNVFALISAGKLDDAEKEANLLPEKNDVLANFARACVALKRGRPQDAANWTEKTVELAPGFAWGYRTLGFIQEKSLKSPGSAERAYERALATAPDFKDVRDLLIDLRLSKNDFDGAIASAKDAIKLFPKDAANYYRLAQIYTQQWRLLEALEQLEKASVLDKTDARFSRSRAHIFRHQGKLSEAIEEQKKAVELGKDKSFEYIELAGLQENVGDVAGSIASLQSALKENTGSQQAHQRLVALLQKEKKYAELVNEYRRVVERNPKQASSRIGLAEILIEQGNYDEALAELKEAANLEQTNPKPHRLTGKIELARKNYPAAAKAYTRALNINPSSVEDLVALGYCYASNNDYMQAETAFVTGLALQQLSQTSGTSTGINPYDIMRSLASVLLAEGRYREATVNMDAVLLVDKDPVQKRQDRFLLAQCKALKDRTAEGVKELQDSFDALTPEEQVSERAALVDVLSKLEKHEAVTSALSKIPADDLKQQSPVLFVKLLRLTGKANEAEEAAKSAISVAKGDDREVLADLHVELAGLLRTRGDTTGAEEALAKAVDVNPKAFNAFVAHGKIYLAQKKFEYALGQATRAIEVNPYSVDAYLLQGQALLETGKLPEAEAAYLKAVELYPTLPDAHRGMQSVYLRQSKKVEAQKEAEIIANLEKQS